MFRMVGTEDAVRPNSPRSNTMEGRPVWAPGMVATASSPVPSTVPTTTATIAASSESRAPVAGCST